MNTGNEKMPVSLGRRPWLIRTFAMGLIVVLSTTVVAAEDEVLVTSARVNVRARPTTNGNVLFQVTRGETLHVIEKVGEWYHIETPSNRKGYVFETLVKRIELRSESSPSPDVDTGATRGTDPRSSHDGRSGGLEAAQARSFAEKRRQGLYKILGGTAGVVTGLIVMDSSKPVGIGLVGAGGYFLWDGYRQHRRAGRQLRWALGIQLDRDTKGVVYQMSW